MNEMTEDRGLKVPYKPFTIDEVQRLTGCRSADLDSWTRRGLLPLHHGNGVDGLDWMQAFAALVGRRWLEEGAPRHRADEVVRYVGSITLDHVLGKFDLGLSFPATPSAVGKACPGLGMMVEPPESLLGRRLDLRPMLAEFRARLQREFPNG